MSTTPVRNLLPGIPTIESPFFEQIAAALVPPLSA